MESGWRLKRVESGWGLVECRVWAWVLGCRRGRRRSHGGRWSSRWGDRFLGWRRKGNGKEERRRKEKGEG